MALSDQIDTLATAYLDAADYSVTGDCTKARTFEATLRKLLILPKTAFHASESLTFAPEVWLQLLQDVQVWIGSNCAAVGTPPSINDANVGGAIHFDMSDFRT